VAGTVTGPREIPVHDDATPGRTLTDSTPTWQVEPGARTRGTCICVISAPTSPDLCGASGARIRDPGDLELVDELTGAVTSAG
jgi:hypothetical protein